MFCCVNQAPIPASWPSSQAVLLAQYQIKTAITTAHIITYNKRSIKPAGKVWQKHSVTGPAFTQCELLNWQCVILYKLTKTAIITAHIWIRQHLKPIKTDRKPIKSNGEKSWWCKKRFCHIKCFYNYLVLRYRYIVTRHIWKWGWLPQQWR